MNMEKQKATVGQINRFRKREIFDTLGERDDLGILSGGLGDGITSSRIDINGVDAPVTANNAAQLNRYVTPACADVSAAPSWTDAETL
jgi:hypothetical protein